jgi:hypothetical protein
MRNVPPTRRPEGRSLISGPLGSALEIVETVGVCARTRLGLVERLLDQARLDPWSPYSVVTCVQGTTSYGEKRAGPVYQPDSLGRLLSGGRCRQSLTVPLATEEDISPPVRQDKIGAISWPFQAHCSAPHRSGSRVWTGESIDASMQRPWRPAAQSFGLRRRSVAGTPVAGRQPAALRRRSRAGSLRRAGRVRQWWRVRARR